MIGSPALAVNRLITRGDQTTRSPESVRSSRPARMSRASAPASENAQFGPYGAPPRIVGERVGEPDCLLVFPARI